jgi:hypothetical protein
LEQYPSERAAAVELTAIEKQTTNVLEDAMIRAATKKLIWKRYQAIVGMDELGGGIFACFAKGSLGMGTNSELLQGYVTAWSTRVKNAVLRRREIQQQEAHRNSQLEKYVNGRAIAIQKAQVLRADLHDWPVAKVNERRRNDQVVLPQLCQDREKLVNYFDGWATPRPSPYYKLHVFNVLNEAAAMHATATCLFPLLGDRCSQGQRSAAETDAGRRGGGGEECEDGSSPMEEGRRNSDNTCNEDAACLVIPMPNAGAGGSASAVKLPSLGTGSIEDTAQGEIPQSNTKFMATYNNMLS